MRRTGPLVAVTLAALTTLLVVAGCAGAPEEGMRFGVLGAHCSPERAGPLADAGVRLAELRVDWAALQPVPGPLDPAAAERLRDEVSTCRDAGVDVVLGSPLHSAPPWVSALPAGRYRDAGGREGPVDVPNVVFSAAVRDAYAGLVARLRALVPPEEIEGWRVGTSENGELGFPVDSHRDGYWAFDDAVTTGSGLARGALANPMPGWRPGSTTWGDREVTAADAARWFTWYADASSRAVVWQVEVLRGSGFAGAVHLPLAGRGVLPSDLALALAGVLDGSGDRDGSLVRGLFYPQQLASLARGAPGIVADVTGLDDATAVQARRLRPPQDGCRPDDATRDLAGDPTVATWSASRWTVANARRAGLAVVGENPGSPDAAGTGGDDDSDDLATQLGLAPRYAVGCGLDAFFLAFEDDLFGPGTDGVDLQTYAAVIDDSRKRNSP